MKVLFTGGFTLGSVTPLIAVAEELKHQKAEKLETLWIGTRKGPERKLVAEEGIKFIWLWTPKWRRYFDVRNLFTPPLLFFSVLWAVVLLLRHRPNVVASAGGYIGVPLVWAAWLLRIPCLLHNQDARFSLANKLAAPFVEKITYVLPNTIPAQWQDKSVFTGNPVRKFILQGDKARGLERCGFKDTRLTILVIGGGTGARRLNELVVEALPELVQQYNIIHLTGRGKGQEFETNNQKSGYCTFELVTKEIADLYAAADLVITRAGIGVLTELVARRLPMLIVPLPGTHQEDNARYFKTYAKITVVSQDKLDGEKLVEAVARSVVKSAHARRDEMNEISELARPDAAKHIAEEIEALVKK